MGPRLLGMLFAHPPLTATTRARRWCFHRSCFHRHSAASGASCRAADRFTSTYGPQCPRSVERRRRTTDDHPHDDHGPPSAALRSPASGSRPRHRGRDHRHESRRPSLDGPWVARQGTEGRGKPGRDEPEGIGTPARSPGAPATREEAHGTTSARPRLASKLEIHVEARACPTDAPRSGS